MTNQNMTTTTHQHHGKPSFWKSRSFVVFLMFAAIAGVLLWEEHRAHFLGVLPYLFIFACPLMHLFHHGGHRHHRHGGGDSGRST